MNISVPKRLATVGGVLISISGIVNSLLGIRIGALVYDAYPGGRMGHVGIVAGVIAVVIGLVIIYVIVPIYNRETRGFIVLGGILTIVFGHLGGIAGAIYIGTLGVLLCYIAGIWLLVVAIRSAIMRQRPQ
jgi:uncharacterized BrkB/YihY/UPF0761 family membrane protein